MRSEEPQICKDSDYYLYTPSTTAQSMYFYPICVGNFKYEPGYCLKRNHYDSFLIMLITKGRCQVVTDTESFCAASGQVVLLDCYSPHQYGSDTGWEALWLHFDGPMAHAYYGHIIKGGSSLLFPKNVQSIEHTMHKIHHMFQNCLSIVEPLLSKYITDILTELLISESPKETASKNSLSLSDTISYITEHFSDPITLESLAARACLSPFYFSRVFAAEAGMTPYQYLLATRINAAKYLLKTTKTSIKEIGFSCGFHSESSFCIAFKKSQGITPSQYRTGFT